MLAVAVGHDAPPAQAQTLSAPEPYQMQRSCLGFYLWWEESPGATGYDIQIRSESGSTWGTWSDVTLSGTTQPAIVTGLTHGTNYQWQIRADKNGTKSAWSEPVPDGRDTRTAISCAQGKPNPPILHSAVPGPGKVTLTWEAGPEISGATVIGYVVKYRWQNEQEEWIKRSTNAVSADTTTAEVTGLTPGTAYHVWVKPITAHGEGAGSRTLDATPQSTSTPAVSAGRCNHQGATPPGLAPISSFTSTHDSITLNWDSPDYGTTASGTKGFITDFLVWTAAVDGSYDGLQIVSAYGWEPATYSHTISGLSASTDYTVGVNARTMRACFSGWSSVAVSTTAALNSGGLQIGVLPRPTQEEQPEQTGQAEQTGQPEQAEQPENESTADSQPAPETAPASAPEPETEPAPESETEPQQASESEAEPAADTQPAPETEPESESEPVPEPDDVVARYDANGDGVIDTTEYQQVKTDWLAGKVTYDEFLTVVRAYLKSG